MAHTYWKVSCVLPEAAALSVETAFEDVALSAGLDAGPGGTARADFQFALHHHQRWFVLRLLEFEWPCRHQHPGERRHAGFERVQPGWIAGLQQRDYFRGTHEPRDSQRHTPELGRACNRFNQRGVCAVGKYSGANKFFRRIRRGCEFDSSQLHRREQWQRRFLDPGQLDGHRLFGDRQCHARVLR